MSFVEVLVCVCSFVVVGVGLVGFGYSMVVFVVLFLL
jgi:hypothetical protein